MARGDSVIRVSIIGDALGLNKAITQANTKLGTFGASVGGIAKGFLALGAIREGFQFIKDATGEADRLADSATRLNIQLGGDLGAKVENMAQGFVKLGLSQQDVQELAANFADLATAIGIADPIIADLAPTVAATAQAMQLLGHGDAATNVDLIGKAAGGSARAAKELGVTLITGASAADQLANIMAQLKPQLDSATTGSSDLEQSQAELQARWETLEAHIGGPLSDALTSVVGFINDEIDAIPGAIAGWQMLGAAIEGFGRTALGPLGNVRDALGGIGDAINNVNKLFGGAFGHATGGVSEGVAADAIRRFRERNGLSGTLGNP